MSAHEVYPGHFTNFALDRHLPLTLSEKLLTATSFVEGWAHYGEQMMVDEGWGGGDPRVRLMQLREAIWRNARYVAGVKLHTQGMTVAQATRFFQTEAFLDPANARAEARRGTQDATYGYYTLGKLEILKLRADYRKKLGSAFTLARFHHDLLQYGDPAIPLLRPLLLGSDDDGKICPTLGREVPAVSWTVIEQRHRRGAFEGEKVIVQVPGATGVTVPVCGSEPLGMVKVAMPAQALWLTVTWPT